MCAETSSTDQRSARTVALESLTVSAATNIPGVDFASITLYSEDHALRTVAPTNPLAEQLDALQYELREGPCYAAVTEERFVLVSDTGTCVEYPRYSSRAAVVGVGAQAALQLVHGQEAA